MHCKFSLIAISLVHKVKLSFKLKSDSWFDPLTRLRAEKLLHLNGCHGGHFPCTAELKGAQARKAYKLTLISDNPECLYPDMTTLDRKV